MELTVKQLENVLTNGNPLKYDSLKLIFKDGFEIWFTDMNNVYYNVQICDGEENTVNIHKDFFDLDEHLLSFHHNLRDDGGCNYQDIELIIVWYHNDQNVTDYTGEKLGEVCNKNELKKFFLRNKESLKDAKFGGSRIMGIGEKSVYMGNDVFISYHRLYRMYRGDEYDYVFDKIFNLIKV